MDARSHVVDHISSDAEPHQQCALVISQLGGAAREVARTLTPTEVYQGGIVNGQQLDPISYLLHGLSVRFGPLEDEVRLRAAQDLLNFTRRNGEGTDNLLSRFEIVHQRARAEGGGATVSTETASLLLLRAVGVNHGQFQQLTQPFGYRLPTNEAEYLIMTSAIRRLGHIVESHRDNIASTLRSGNRDSNSNSYWAGDAEQTGGDHGDDERPHGTSGEQGWAYHAGHGGDSDTDSATSSDNNSLMDNTDLAGMNNGQVDEYLFGRYQHAKRRWRRFSGKPVRAIRRTLRKKGKGKGSKGGLGHAYLNINEVLQNSYFKGKGKGGNSSGKGFGRRINPKGRDGEVMKCSICQSQYHLRAKCPQRPNTATTSQPSSGVTGQIHATAQPNRSMYVHFAAFPAQAESEQSWNRVSTPRPSQTDEPQQSQHEGGVEPGDNTQDRPPEVHAMTPDPLQENDPWLNWMNDQSRPPTVYGNQPAAVGPMFGTYAPHVPQVPPWHVQDVRTFQEVTGQMNPRVGAMDGDSVPTLNLPPVPASYAAQTQVMQGMVERSVASETVGLFSELCTPEGGIAGLSKKAPLLMRRRGTLTRSTFSSELFAATDAIDAGLLTRLVLHELKHGPLTDQVAKQLIEGSRSTDIQLHAVLDAKSVTSAITAPFLKVPAEPSLLVHVRWVRALLQGKVLDGLWWADTRSMLADGLTKGSVDRSALETVANGWHEIRHALTNEGQRLVSTNCSPEGTTLEP